MSSTEQLQQKLLKLLTFMKNQAKTLDILQSTNAELTNKNSDINQVDAIRNSLNI